jgi:hypothetical protein
MSENAGSKTLKTGPSEAAAGTMDTAVRAARDGAADARAAVDRALPAISRFVSRFVYTTSYSLSYGFVFPTMLLVRVIPKDNALVHGLVDGAQAATDLVDDWQAGRSVEPARPLAIQS